MSDNPLKYLARTFGNAPIIKAKVPEALDDDGKPVIIRFRTRLTPGDLEAMAEMAPKTIDLVHLALFRLLAIDNNGEPLVNDADDDAFVDGLDGKLISKIVERCGLMKAAYDDLPNLSGDGDADESEEDDGGKK